MRVKLLNVLTVCVVTFVVLSPVLVVFSVVWERHIELVKPQNVACEVNNSSNLSLLLNSTHSSQLKAPLQSSNRNVVNQMLTIGEQYKLATILQWFFVLTPICVGLGIIFYDRYLFYRAAVLKEQVEMLERLWQQSIEQ